VEAVTVQLPLGVATALLDVTAVEDAFAGAVFRR
jgi:hypothetical protein